MIDVFITHPEDHAAKLPALYAHVAQFADETFTTEEFRRALWRAVQHPERSTLGASLWEAARYIHLEGTCNGHSPTPIVSANHEAFNEILQDALNLLATTFHAYHLGIDDACHPALLPVIDRLYT